MSRFRPWGVSTSEAVDLALAGGAPPRWITHKFGENPTAASGDAIWSVGGAFPYLTYTGTALAMRVKAGGNAADTAAGAGARTVTIQGLDENFQIASETVTLAGISASAATTTTFSRVLRAFVATAGANRVNTAAITIEDSGGSADYGSILAGQGQSTIGFLTVPAGYRGHLLEVAVTTDISSASGTLAITGFSRGSANQTAAPFAAKRVFWREPGLSRDSGVAQVTWDQPITFDEYTDVWFETTPSAGTPEVDVEFTVLFEKK